VKKYIFLIIFLGLLVVGGFVTTLSGGAGSIGDFLPFLRQTGSTAASTDYIEPWQGEQLILMIGFILVNIIGIAVTLAGLFWFLNRGIALAKAQEGAEDGEKAA
jgi:hypothetical protein